jgi:hypothetical protein
VSLRVRLMGVRLAHRVFVETRRSLLRVGNEVETTHPRGLWVVAWVRHMRWAWAFLGRRGAT